MKHLRWLLFLLATPACAQFIPHAPAKGGYCLNPSNVWIPINASMQTGSALPNGAPAGDLYGLNSNGTWYGLACDASGKLIIPGAGSPAGSNQQIQFNDNGDFAGASGGTTNGTHFAFGAGSTVDGGISSFGPYVYSGKAIQVLSETYTGPDFETGQSMHLTLSPASSASSNGASGITSLLELADGANYQSGNSFSGLLNVNQSDVNAPNTPPNGINGSVNLAFIDGTAEHPSVTGTINETITDSTGTIDNAVGAENTIIDLNTETISNAQVESVTYTGLNGIAGVVRNVYIAPPILSGGAIGTNTGLYIDAQCGGGITTCAGLVEAEDDPNSIAGVTTFGDLIAPGILTLAEGTTNIAAAGGEGWQFNCSNCDTPLTEGATCTAAGDHAGTLAIALRGAIKCF